MRKGKVGFGIIGYGVIGPWHAKAISFVPQAELVAVCDVDPGREKPLRDEGHAVPFYTSAIEMLKRERDIDAVCVCTPSGLHHKGAIVAAKRGVHVLSEKPLDIKLAHMDRMIDACAQADVKLGCIFQRRTDPDHLLVKKAIERGLLGKLVLGDCYQKYYRAPAYYRSAGWRGTWKLDGGGALMNQCVHGIDMLLWLMGEVESVFSYSGTQVRDIEVEDTSVSVVRFKNGAFGNVVGTTSVVPGQGSRTEIHGENGSIVVGNGPLKCHIARLVKGTHKPQEVDLAKRLRVKARSKKQSGAGVANDPKALSVRGHAMQIEDFCRAVKGEREPMVPGTEARKAVELILAIYRSWKTGKEVKLPLK